MNDKVFRGTAVHTRRILSMRMAFVTSVALIPLMTGPMTTRESGAATRGAATVWASPQVVHYGTVLRDADEPGSQPNFTVFIELADESAADIDPSSVTLNGLPALLELTAVGDANANGIADVMVKFNRSVLIATDGLIKISGNTRRGGCFAGETSVEIRCLPVAVDRLDYPIEFTTSNMPDPQFDGLSASLNVHRVKPVFPRGCPNVSPIRALVLVHGRTIPATAAFDLGMAAQLMAMNGPAARGPAS